MIKHFFQVASLTFLAGCAVERAQVAQEAQAKMIGLTKEQVLTCMGAPGSKAAEGHAEVWTYNTGNGHTQVSSFSSGSVMAVGNANSVSGSGFGSSVAVASTRYCVVSVVMSDGQVTRVNYSGPTGGLVTGGEQCAFAVRNCVQ